MDRAKAYSWLLTIIMSVAITTAVKELSQLLAIPSGSAPSLSPPPIAAAVIRFFIFLLLSVRSTLGVLWYFDKAYISKQPPVPLGRKYFIDFFISFLNFLFFVPLALTVTTSALVQSPLSIRLNSLLLGGKNVSSFIWILALLLFYDSLWLFVDLVTWFFTRKSLGRVQIFWFVLNLFTFLLCGFIFLLYGFLGKDLQNAEVWILAVLIPISLFYLYGTVLETSSLSKQLSP
jgi:hypothetical protein